MERLTYSLHPGYTLTEEMQKEYIEDKIKKLTDKVGKYEDLEEQIGCPLMVLVRALKDGVYTKNDIYGKDVGNGLKYFEEIYISTNGIELLHNSMFKGIESIGTIQIKDYKKTWWLKEDKSE